MSQKQSSQLNQKKAQVMGRDSNPKSRKLPASIALAVLLAAGAALLAANLAGGPEAPSPPAATATSGEVTHPVAELADGKARHYSFRTPEGLTIRYFLIQSSDGVIRAAFDACDVCWPENRGYSQSGDYMVCNNCGRRFASVLVNEVQGGCNPAPLRRTVRGDRLVIAVPDLLAGRRYFDFGSRS
jgi:uncharacterized membrane protein